MTDETPPEEVRRSVVVVDDDRLLLTLLVQALTESGYEVEGFFTTAEAEARLRTDPCGILISDQAMASKDEGTMFLQSAMELGWCHGALLISGYPQDATLDEQLHPSFRFLRKPFQLAQLLDVCDEILSS